MTTKEQALALLSALEEAKNDLASNPISTSANARWVLAKNAILQALTGESVDYTQHVRAKLGNVSELANWVETTDYLEKRLVCNVLRGDCPLTYSRATVLRDEDIGRLCEPDKASFHTTTWEGFLELLRIVNADNPNTADGLEDEFPWHGLCFGGPWKTTDEGYSEQIVYELSCGLLSWLIALSLDWQAAIDRPYPGCLS